MRIREGTWEALLVTGFAALLLVMIITRIVDGPVVLFGAAGGLAAACCGGYAWAKRSPALVALSVLMFVGVLVDVVDYPTEGHEGWTLPIAVGLVVLAASIGVGYWIVTLVGTRELERLIWMRAVAVAFFSTLVGAGLCGALEHYAGAPQVNLAAVLPFGFGSWAGAATVLQRRLS